MTKQQQLIALQGMDDLLIHERQALFNELQNMGLITEYTHLPGIQYGIPDR
jgi:hypothetical protein